MIGEALVDGGFAVAQASTPEDARDMIDAPDAAYRALVTDINLAPGQETGWDFAKRARTINADLPVVYMTGDSGDQWASCGVPNSVLITKPFAPIAGYNGCDATPQYLNSTGEIDHDRILFGRCRD